MNLFVVGYEQCPYFMAACSELSVANISYTSILVQDKDELRTKVRQIKRLHPVEGVSGATSPQILRVEPTVVVCIGGHDSLEHVGLENVMSWCPLAF
tara:strand:- start:284 stop:574 length:291 start_codon:yes stop_codon:yes gene_type:complete